MNKLIFVLCSALFLLMATQLPATNHMDIISTLTDDFNGAEFGGSMVSMDFNGDGYKDLIVKAPKWNPTGVYSDDLWYGKIYFYWGGPGFDNVADFLQSMDSIIIIMDQTTEVGNYVMRVT